MAGILISAGIAASAQAPDALPSAPEAALVQKTCTGCHVASQFTSQRKSADQWAETVNQMIGYGAQVSDDQFGLIVNYLAKFYGIGDSKSRQGN